MKTWLINGVAGGLGLAAPDLALARGDGVIGTVRQQSQPLAFAARQFAGKVMGALAVAASIWSRSDQRASAQSDNTTVLCQPCCRITH